MQLLCSCMCTKDAVCVLSKLEQTYLQSEHAGVHWLSKCKTPSRHFLFCLEVIIYAHHFSDCQRCLQTTIMTVTGADTEVGYEAGMTVLSVMAGLMASLDSRNGSRMCIMTDKQEGGHD